MAVIFPPVHHATDEGLLALGGILDIETLVEAYSSGIFPWPIDKNSPMTWFSPDPRGILPYENLHIPKSLKRFLKKNPYRVTFNQNFSFIIMSCAKAKRKHEKGTWISQDIIDGYSRLFDHGLAYSVEVWDDEEIVGGVYGVCLQGNVTGESMFHTKDNASKVALLALMQKLKEADIAWLDTQMVTGVVEALGGIEIPRYEFIEKLNKSKRNISRNEIFKNA